MKTHNTPLFSCRLRWLVVLILIAIGCVTHRPAVAELNWQEQVQASFISGIPWDYNNANWQPDRSATMSTRLIVDGQAVDAVGQPIAMVHSELATAVRIECKPTSQAQNAQPWTRTEVMVRGKRPYALVFDDVQRPEASQVIEWAWPVPTTAHIDIWIVNDGDGQPYAADSRFDATQGHLLIRALQFQGGGGTFDKNVSDGRSLNWPGYLQYQGPEAATFLIPSFSERPDFKILMLPHAKGDQLPVTTWFGDGAQLVIEWSDQKDVLHFDTKQTSLTGFRLERHTGDFRGTAINIDGPAQKKIQSENADPQQSLVGHWSFDEIQGQQVKDSSRYANHGQLQDGARWTSGMVGKGLDPISSPNDLPGQPLVVRDAKDQVPPVTYGRMVLPAKVLDPIEDEFTISMWYTGPPVPKGQPAAPYVQNPQTKRTGQLSLLSLGPGAGNQPNNRNLDLRINSHFLSDAVCLNLAGGHRTFEMLGIKIPDAWLWHHLAITAKGKQATLYIDGKKSFQAEIPNTVASIPKGEKLYILDGLWSRIDELRIHNAALSENQIQSMMYSEGFGRLTHFDFDNGQSELSQDLTKTQWVSDTNGAFAKLVNAKPTANGPQVQSVQFDGQSQMQIPLSIFQGKAMDGITVSLKVRFAEGSLKGRKPIFATNNHTREGIYLYHWNNRFWSSWSGGNHSSESNLEDGREYHVVITYDNTTQRMFVDGKLVAETPRYVENKPAELSETLTVGRQLNAKEDGFSGELLDVQIFNFALSLDSVMQLMQGKDNVADWAASVSGKELAKFQTTDAKKLRQFF